MSALHRTSAYLNFAKVQRARLKKGLPAPCPRCGGVMTVDMPLDLDHIVDVDRYPAGLLDPSMVRLSHRGCNRRAGQVVTTAKRVKHNLHKARAKRLPNW